MAGLIAVQRQGRPLFYSIRLDRVAELVGYLANDAGRGRPDISAHIHPTKTAMAVRPCKVLFICSGSSTRSIFAEAILPDAGKGRFTACSAGTRPGTQMNPFAIEVLRRAGHDTTQLRSKHVLEFAAPDAPQMDFVFTVCDLSAAEGCAPLARPADDRPLGHGRSRPRYRH